MDTTRITGDAINEVLAGDLRVAHAVIGTQDARISRLEQVIACASRRAAVLQSALRDGEDYLVTLRRIARDEVAMTERLLRGGR